MTMLLIGKAELAALVAGTPAVVAPLGMEGLEALPVAVLVPRAGVLRRLGEETRDAGVPLPEGLRPLALVAPDAAAAEALAAQLPLPGLPRLLGPDPLPALAARLAAALAESEAARGELRRLLGARPAPLPHRIIDLAPAGPASPAARHSQPLGRPAEGISAVALHLAGVAAGRGSRLVVRLLAGDRVAGAWSVPGPSLAEGWLLLDLPEPVPPGPAEAVLEVLPMLAAGDRLTLSAAAPEAPGAAAPPLALQVEAAAPGHAAAPLFFDWAARDLPAVPPGVVLPIGEAALAAARIEGATARRVAAGHEAARLVLEIPAGADALVALPPLPVGTAELALAECATRLGAPPAMALRARPEGSEGDRRDTGWRVPDAEGALRLALPLPPAPSGAVRLTLALHNASAAPATLELARLALMGGAAGVPRRAPAAAPLPDQPPVTGIAPPPAPAATATAMEVQPAAVEAPGPRASVSLPAAPPPAAPAGTAPALALPPIAAAVARAVTFGTGYRVSPPQPPLASGGAGGPAMAAAEAAPAGGDDMPALPALPVVTGPWTTTAFQDLQLHQHLVSADGGYRHIEVSITGLTAAAGLWRLVRMKLFDRRGTVGLEFRDARGWPQVFDTWPGTRSDAFGRFWRLETEATETALGQLGSAHDRALIAALLELLPGIALRAARAATLPAAEQEEWSGRARGLVASAEAARQAERAAAG